MVFLFGPYPNGGGTLQPNAPAGPRSCHREAEGRGAAEVRTDSRGEEKTTIKGWARGLTTTSELSELSSSTTGVRSGGGTSASSSHFCRIFDVTGVGLYREPSSRCKLEQGNECKMMVAREYTRISQAGTMSGVCMERHGD